MKTILAVLAFLTVAADARADDTPDTYTTVFSFTRFGPDGSQVIAGFADDTVPISLPPSLSGWVCERSPLLKKYEASERISCHFGDYSTGFSVSCPLDEKGTDSGTFSLRSKRGPGVLFVGQCVTIRNRSVDDGF